MARALGILRLLGRSADGMALKALAAEMGLKGPTAHHIVATLTQEGFAERLTGPTRYRLGPAMRELALGAARGDWRRRAEAVLTRLAADLPGAIVVLSEDVGGDVTVTLRLTPERPGVIQRPADQTLAPYASASPLVFQAFWPADRREAYRRRYPFEEYGRGRWPSTQALEAALDRVRAEEQVLLLPQESGGLIRTAVPVFGNGAELAGVLGASIPCDRPDEAMATGGRMARRIAKAAAHLAGGLPAGGGAATRARRRKRC